MSIKTLQEQARELGRIRMGRQEMGSNGKLRPAKLDTFRLTSPSQELIETAAAMYGGEPGPWIPVVGGAVLWEVVTTSARLPIYVPPQPISQWFESWTGGGCVRRCDGEREVLTDVPCLCGPDPATRQCQPTTRLNVILRDVPGIGVWRLESHGYYAAVELPAVARFLAATGGYVSAHLTIVPRTVKRPGQKTKQFMVPAIEVAVTPAEIMSGEVPGVALSGGTAGPRELAAAPVASAVSPEGGRVYADSADGAPSLEALTRLLAKAQEDGFCTDMTDGNDPLVAAFRRARQRLTAAPQPKPIASADELWFTVMSSCPETWTTDELEADFERVTGVAPAAATAEHMTAYLSGVRAGADA